MKRGDGVVRFSVWLIHCFDYRKKLNDFNEVLHSKNGLRLNHQKVKQKCIHKENRNRVLAIVVFSSLCQFRNTFISTSFTK